MKRMTRNAGITMAFTAVMLFAATSMAAGATGNTKYGSYALYWNGSYGDNNTAMGNSALKNNLDGDQNTAMGINSLYSNQRGINNTAVGTSALISNLASHNTGVGAWALEFNQTGQYNTALGVKALADNEKGGNSTAIGYYALKSNKNVTGANTAIGAYALEFNLTGQENTAMGHLALRSGKNGYRNNAMGSSALRNFESGGYNTALGYYAGWNTTSGYGNSIVGSYALPGTQGNGFSGNYNTTMGYKTFQSLESGSYNVGLGLYAGYYLKTGSNNVYISNYGGSYESGTIRIGQGAHTKTFIAGIRGVPTGIANAVNVVIDSNGQLGTVQSSRRFKEDIQDMAKMSEGLMNLRPVTFRYKQASDDGSKPVQYGLIAEEVAEVYPDLVVHGQDGKVETVQYHKLTSMLLNELQKQHRVNEAQKVRLQAQDTQLADLKTQVKVVQTQYHQLQDLSARLVRLEGKANAIPVSLH